MIRLKIGFEIRHGGLMNVCATEGKTAADVVASYRSVSRNPVRFKTWHAHREGVGDRFYLPL